MNRPPVTTTHGSTQFASVGAATKTPPAASINTPLVVGTAAGTASAPEPVHTHAATRAAPKQMRNAAACCADTSGMDRSIDATTPLNDVRSSRQTTSAHRGATSTN